MFSFGQLLLFTFYNFFLHVKLSSSVVYKDHYHIVCCLEFIQQTDVSVIPVNVLSLHMLAHELAMTFIMYKDNA